MEELRKDAEKLAEERRVASEQALEWMREVRMDSDDEKERKPKKPCKHKTDGPGSGDEAEPKKKRRGKLKRMGGPILPHRPLPRALLLRADILVRVFEVMLVRVHEDCPNIEVLWDTQGKVREFKDSHDGADHSACNPGFRRLDFPIHQPVANANVYATNASAITATAAPVAHGARILACLDIQVPVLAGAIHAPHCWTAGSAQVATTQFGPIANTSRDTPHAPPPYVPNQYYTDWQPWSLQHYCLAPTSTPATYYAVQYPRIRRLHLRITLLVPSEGEV
ncbi:hypothetical protein B0H12DRAFT_1231011 [Mycena haematopus]|nr:hypothetical protein B0H12DRAFT_1231011 [Mycena haematopus]